VGEVPRLVDDLLGLVGGHLDHALFAGNRPALTSDGSG
jgi:hypothetical protein